MNLAMFKKNIGWRMKLAPPACHLDSYGVALPERNEDWIVASVTDEVIELSAASGHRLILGTDHVVSFFTNPQEAGPDSRNGIVQLKVQAFIQGARISLTPTARPGERVDPPSVNIREKEVSFNYPTESGIQPRLVAEGFRLVWSNQSDVSDRIDIHGWELVIEKDRQGHLCSFICGRPGSRMVLLKKRG